MESQFLPKIEMTWAEHLFVLDGRRALFMPDSRTLVVCDLHLGKAQHFRKAGIAIPGAVSEATLARLNQLLYEYQPLRVLILGDLFHSGHYEDLYQFEELVATHSEVDWVIVEGNHDKGFINEAARLGLEFLDECYIEHSLFFYHGNRRPQLAAGQFGISGHIHPGIKLYGRGGLNEKLPCFCFSQTEAVLPAFGEFTGLHIIKPKDTDQVYGITENLLFPVRDASRFPGKPLHT